MKIKVIKKLLKEYRFEPYVAGVKELSICIYIALLSIGFGIFNMLYEMLNLNMIISIIISVSITLPLTQLNIIFSTLKILKEKKYKEIDDKFFYKILVFNDIMKNGQKLFNIEPYLYKLRNDEINKMSKFTQFLEGKYKIITLILHDAYVIRLEPPLLGNYFKLEDFLLTLRSLILYCMSDNTNLYDNDTRDIFKRAYAISHSEELVGMIPDLLDEWLLISLDYLSKNNFKLSNDLIKAFDNIENLSVSLNRKDSKTQNEDSYFLKLTESITSDLL
ncbi:MULTISPECIES: hypothetical protein [unclassified Clostridioides]|uniref:hypothetical protein n=1 Tax=unclassified Clostridioides TaxID=2635829 RepID=UPI001D12617E|nr:hypothetical protein [Clostridioides sp. ES-S-0145-01]MCC0682286.1 hypothetical protein [Clostridioides sp. ES-S-0005-03]MCC0705443.1 hypothetical protein [Clostridioides sp. ES-S-0190-01]UDN63952.1 hypothetical protein IC758_20315 [Clostridioides sp. ES-W-0016-02]